MDSRICASCERCASAFTMWRHEHANGRRYCSRACHYARTPDSELARFWTYVERGANCWMWTGTIAHAGHGKFWCRGKSVHAHRFAYVSLIGAVEADKCVLHRCDNPRCVRPDHLFVGDRGVNNRDRHAKGRDARSETHGSRTQPQRVRRGANHGMAKLTAPMVQAIRRDYTPFRTTRNQLAIRYGVSRSLINQILAGSIWQEH